MPFDNTTQDTTERVTPVGCTCETCKLARFEGSAIRFAVVHSYSYRPLRWKMNRVTNDPFDYFLGVELETDNYKIDRATSARVRSGFTNNQAADMRRPKMLWMAKSDSSVSGPEFVSHPATLSYWQKNKSKVKDMFQMLVHAGFRSHDNDHAGMHINISKNAFASPDHLFRFLSLIHGNTAWALKMSQRTASSAEQWASLDYLANATKRREEVQRIMPAAGTPPQTDYGRLVSNGSSHRYQALNCPQGQSRFEFRLPRGTLRLDRFMKNLEWTVAMIEYARTRRVVDMKAIPFMRWAVTNQEQYPNLVAFLVERFENLIIVPTTSLADAANATAAAGDELAVALNSGRISPRTGLPVRSYSRREGARQPGRPVGYRVRPTDTRVVADFPNEPECGFFSASGFSCEYRVGHSGQHGAPSIGRPDFMPAPRSFFNSAPSLT